MNNLCYFYYSANSQKNKNASISIFEYNASNFRAVNPQIFYDKYTGMNIYVFSCSKAQFFRKKIKVQLEILRTKAAPENPIERSHTISNVNNINSSFASNLTSQTLDYSYQKVSLINEYIECLSDNFIYEKGQEFLSLISFANIFLFDNCCDNFFPYPFDAKLKKIKDSFLFSKGNLTQQVFEQYSEFFQSYNSFPLSEKIKDEMYPIIIIILIGISINSNYMLGFKEISEIKYFSFITFQFIKRFHSFLTVISKVKLQIIKQTPTLATDVMESFNNGMKSLLFIELCNKESILLKTALINEETSLSRENQISEIGFVIFLLEALSVIQTPQQNKDDFLVLERYFMNFIRKYYKKGLFNFPREEKLINALTSLGSYKEDMFEVIFDLESIKLWGFQYFANKISTFPWKNTSPETYEAYIKKALFVIDYDWKFLFNVDPTNFIYFILLCINISYDDFNSPLRNMQGEIINRMKSCVSISSLNDIIFFINNWDKLKSKTYAAKNLKDIFILNFYQKITYYMLTVQPPFDSNQDVLFKIFTSKKEENFFNFEYVAYAYIEGSDFKGPAEGMSRKNLEFNDLFFFFNGVMIPSIERFMDRTIFSRILFAIVKVLNSENVVKGEPSPIDIISSIYKIEVYSMNQKYNIVNANFASGFWGEVFNRILFEHYIEFSDKISEQNVLDRPYVTPIQEYIRLKINASDFAQMNVFLSLFVDENQRLKVTSKNIEEILKYFLNTKCSSVSIEENFISKIVESPSKEDFWFPLVNSGTLLGECEYIGQLVNKIKGFYKNCIEAKEITFGQAKMIKDYYFNKEKEEKKATLIDYIYFSFEEKTQKKKIKAKIEETLDQYTKKEESLTKSIKVMGQFVRYLDEDAKGVFEKVSDDYFKTGISEKKLVEVNLEKEMEIKFPLLSSFEKWSNSVAFNTQIQNVFLQFKASDLKTFCEYGNEIARSLESLYKPYLTKGIFRSKKEPNARFYLVNSKLFNAEKEYMVIKNVFTELQTENESNILIKDYLKLAEKYNKDSCFANLMMSLEEKIELTDTNKWLFEMFLSYIDKNDEAKPIETVRLRYLCEKLEQLYETYFGGQTQEDVTLLKNFISSYSLNKDLVLFLTKVPENEIISLADLIDDQSDSFLNEQVLLDLISLKKLLRVHSLTLVEDPQMRLSEGGFISKIKEGIADLPIMDKLLKSCGDLIISIKNLYKELSNKTEANSVKIQEIVTSSVVNIEGLDFQLVFRNGKNKLSYRDFNELKDRCLLFVSSAIFSKAPDGNEKFVAIVNLINAIFQYCEALETSGYPIFIKNTISITQGSTENLKTFLDFVRQIYVKWENDIEKSYKNFYPLTLYHGKQFWELEKYLVHGSPSTDYGKNLIKRIKGEESLIQKSLLEDNLIIQNNEFDSPDQRLEKLGKKLCQCITNFKEIYRSEERVKIPREEIQVPLEVFPTKQKNLFLGICEKSSTYQYILSIYISFQNCLPFAPQILFCHENLTHNILYSFLLRAAMLKDTSILFMIVGINDLSYELQKLLVSFIRDKTYDTYSLCLLSTERFTYITNELENGSDDVMILRQINILRKSSIISLIRDNKLINSKVVTSKYPGEGKSHYIKNYKEGNQLYQYYSVAIEDDDDINEIVDSFYSINRKDGDDAAKKKIHITIRGLIKNYDLIDNILFRYIFLGEIVIPNDIKCCSCTNQDLIIIEINNGVDISRFNILQYVPSDIRVAFSLNEFDTSLIEENKNQKENFHYFINYLHFYSKELLEENDVLPSSQFWLPCENLSYSLKLINEHVLKYQSEVIISYRLLWMYINIVGSQLRSLSRCPSFTKESLAKINKKDMKAFLLESLLKSCEEFSMNKNIISWKSMSNKYLFLFSERFPLSIISEDNELLPGYLSEYISQSQNDLGNYQSKTHDELLEILLRYTNKSEEQVKEKKKKGSIDNEKYVITADNFLKMILVIQRVQADVPIILIGETGCGKTSLVRYIVDEILNETFYVINIHAGITKRDLINRISNIRDQNIDKPEERIWIFLDEINTCNHLGLISEIICEHKMGGLPLPRNFYFIGAANPYKEKLDLSVKSSSVGLINPKKKTLVYTVNPFPDNINDFIWDYGELKNEDYYMYITKILSDLNYKGLKPITVCNLVYMSQMFINQHENNYVVSLRDISRFKALYVWFPGLDNFFSWENYYHLHSKDNSVENDYSLKSVLMTLYICYYIKLSSYKRRTDYLSLVAKELCLEFFEVDNFINHTINSILSQLQIDKKYAMNTALKENLFCLIVALINKIPLFICGKPGNSKTLSVQIIIRNFLGEESKGLFPKMIPKIFPIYYQGSEMSTSSGIQKVFERANQILSLKKEVTPLIIFDEIGLAEISPNNPLKVLHSLFDYQKIAFVGISNWTLDASKMSRVLFLARPDQELEDLNKTGKVFYETLTPVEQIDQQYCETIIKIYSSTYYFFTKSLVSTPYAEFYGIRDYYSMLSQMITGMDRKMSLCRSFGGIEGKVEDIINIFNFQAKKFSMDSLLINGDPYNPIECILSNIHTQQKTDNGNRYLLLFHSPKVNIIFILNHYLTNTKSIGPKIYFKIIIGSKFKNDYQKSNYTFKILSEIILCMEKGICVVLQELDYIYGALYDLFNQNFLLIGGRKNCRIALGGMNNPLCFVNDSFRCIVVSESADLPPPFLNRFEKQLITYDKIVTPKEKEIRRRILNWLYNTLKFSKEFCSKSIVGYNEDEFIYSLIRNNSSKSAPQGNANSQFTEEDHFEYLIRKDILKLVNLNFLLGLTIDKNFDKVQEVNLVLNKYFEQSHESFDRFYQKYSKTVFRCIVYTYSNLLEKIQINTKEELNEININEISSEKEFLFRLQNGKGILIVKIDYIKDKQHINYLKVKLNERSLAYSHIYLIIYLSSSKDPLINTINSDWYHFTIDAINSKSLVDLKSLIKCSSIDIFKKFMNKRLFIESVNKVMLSLNYTSSSYEISNHIIYIINAISMNNQYYDMICKVAYQLITKKKVPDWKSYIISQSDKYSINNIEEIIKDFVYTSFEEHFRKIFYLIESSNSFDFFIMNKELFLEVFEKIVFSNSFRTLKISNIRHVEFNYKFPFSFYNVDHMIKVIQEDIEKISIIDETVGKNSANYNDDAKEVFNNSFKKIHEIVHSSCFLYNVKNSGNYVKDYINDIFVYFVTYYYDKQEKYIKPISEIAAAVIGEINSTEKLILLFLFLTKNKKNLSNLITLLPHVSDDSVLKKAFEKIKNENLKYENNALRGKIETQLFNSIASSLTNYFIEVFEKIENTQFLEIVSTLSNFEKNESYKFLKIIGLYYQCNFEKKIKLDFDALVNYNPLLLFIVDSIGKKVTKETLPLVVDIYGNILEVDSVSPEVINTMLKDIFASKVLYAHSSTILYKYLSKAKGLSISQTSLSGLTLEEILPILPKKKSRYKFFIDHLSLYLNAQFLNDSAQFLYLDENYSTLINSMNSIKGDQSDNFVQSMAFVKVYFKVFTELVAKIMKKKALVTQKAMSYFEKLNTLLASQSDNAVVTNIQIYILRLLKGLNNFSSLSQMSQYDFEKELRINWINKANFESDENALGIIPSFSYFNTEYKAVEIILTKYTQECDQESRQSFLEYIVKSPSPKTKYSIYHFFITVIYLSYTTKSFASSKKLVKVNQALNDNQVKDALIKFLTPKGYYYILSLVNNKIFPLSLNTYNAGFLLVVHIVYALSISFSGSVWTYFGKIFGNPKESFEKKYIPGNCDDQRDKIRMIEIQRCEENKAELGKKFGLYECQCGYLYEIGNCTRPEGKSDCPGCGEKIGAKSHHVVVDTSKVLINIDNYKRVNKDEVIENIKSKLLKTKGYQYHQRENFEKIRNLSEFNINFFSIINHVMFLLDEDESNALKPLIFKTMPKTLKEEKTEIRKYLEDHVFMSYERIKTIVSTSEAYVILLAFIEKLLNIEDSRMNFDTYDDRTKFENYFENITWSFLNSPSSAINSYRASHTAQTSNIYTKLVSSTAQKAEIKLYSSNLLPIYRYLLDSPTILKWENIVNSAGTKYKFISVLNKYMDQIQLLKNLIPISALSNYLMNLLNYTLSRSEAKTKSIGEVLEVSRNIFQRNLWNNFLAAWKNISYGAVQYKCKVLPKMNSIDLETPVAFVLCDDKEPGYGMYIACAYQFLGDIQNIIYEELEEAKASSYPIQFLSDEDIFSFSLNDINLYERFFYVYEGGYIPDYERIDNDIKAKLLRTSKKLVNYEELNVIQYKYELLSFNQNQHTNFIQNIKEKIPQSQPESSAAMDFLKQELDNNSSYEINKIYTSLETLCCQIKYEKVSPETLIYSYIEESDKGEYYKILQIKLPSTLKTLKLSNIIALYEAVEERIFDGMLDLVSPEYRKPLEDKESVVNSMKEMFFGENSENYPKISSLISAMKKFIVRCLMTDIESSQSLKYYITRNDFWSSNDEDSVDTLSYDLPEEIKISNTIEFYKTLLEIYNETFKKLN